LASPFRRIFPLAWIEPCSIITERGPDGHLGQKGGREPAKGDPY